VSFLGTTLVNGKSPSQFSSAATSVKFMSVLHNALAKTSFVCLQNSRIFPRWNAGALFNGFRKSFGIWNSITFATAMLFLSD
jgi:hypothetical protein